MQNGPLFLVSVAASPVISSAMSMAGLSLNVGSTWSCEIGTRLFSAYFSALFSILVYSPLGSSGDGAGPAARGYPDCVLFTSLIFPGIDTLSFLKYL